MVRNWWRRFVQPKSRTSQHKVRPKKFQRRLELEPLEDRTVPSTISWVNRGGAADTDNFASVFGANANAARAVVDAAITSWERVIDSFNYTFGNTYNITIQMDMAGTGTGAVTGITGISGFLGLGSLPTSATITIGRGADAPMSMDGLGDGVGWWLDPTPLDWSEFRLMDNVLDNAFAGRAAPGSPAVGQIDLYSFVAHELGHAVGITSDRRLRLGSSTTNTGVVDNAPAPYGGQGVGTYYAFVGRNGFRHLLTSVNGGMDAGRAAHSAGPNDPAFPIRFQGRDYQGAHDLMNQSGPPGVRELVPNTMARILQDAYGYTIVKPETFGTFYAMLNQATGNLMIRGGHRPNSNDYITVEQEGNEVVVQVNIGNPVPATGSDSTMVSRFPLASVTSITIDAGDGNDEIIFRSTFGNTFVGVPIVVNAGTGNDTIDVQGVAPNRTMTVNAGDGDDTVNVYNDVNSLGGLQGLLTVNGDGGSNRLNIRDSGGFDRRGITNLTYTVTSDTVTRTNVGTIRHAGFTGGVFLSGSDGEGGTGTYNVINTPTVPLTISALGQRNTINVQRSTGPLTIENAVSRTSVRVSNAGRVNEIRGTVTLRDRGLRGMLVTIDDSAETASKNAVLGPSSLTLLAPASINWQYQPLQLVVNGGSGGNNFRVSNTPARAVLGLRDFEMPVPIGTVLNTGRSGDVVNVEGTDGPLTINGQDGFDTVTLGDTGSAQRIQGAVHVTNERSSTVLTIDNSADTTPRNATLTSSGLSGLAPAAITWQATGLNSLIINGSTANAGTRGNTFTVTSAPRLNSLPATTTLNTGSGSVGDSVTVRRTDKARLLVNGQNGRDTVTISNAGSVQEIKGAVTVTNANGRTALTIDDSASAVARDNVTLTATRLTGLAPEVFELQPVFIEWVERDLSSLVIRGGRGGNTLNITGTPRNDFPVSTTVHTGSRDDTVNVRAVNGPLSIEGQGGDDTFSFRNYSGPVLNNIDGGPGGDTIEVAQGTLSTSQVPFVSVETLKVSGGSTLVLDTDVTTRTVDVTNGTADLRGRTLNLPGGAANDGVQVRDQGIFTGTGTINGDVTNAGQVRPGGDGAVGRLTIQRDYTQTPGGRLQIDLGGPAAGTESDNLDVNRRVQLAGMLNLTALAGFNGNTFELITNRGADDVVNTFANPPEVVVGGRRFRINYAGGTGNDVVLELVPQLPPQVNIQATLPNAAEAGLTAGIFTISRVGDLSAPLTVFYTVAGTATSGSDYGPLSGSVIIPAGQGSVPLTLTPIDDRLVEGNETVQVTLSANAAYTVGTPSSATVTIADNDYNTTTVVTSSPQPSVFGQSVTFTATVSVLAPGTGVPSGTVTFREGTTTLGTATLSNGVATFTTSALSVGNHTITAVYAGTATLVGSEGTVGQTVNRASTEIRVDSLANPAVFGQTGIIAVGFRVLPPGAGTPTGTITLYDNFNGVTTVLGSATLGSPPPALPPLAVGTHIITAVYSGDSNFNGSTSAPLTQVIVAAAAPVVTGLSPSSGSVNGGTVVTISGTGFTGVTQVRFGSTPATAFTVVSPTQITATAPAHSAGVVDVTVTSAGGTSAPTPADRFTYVSAPVANVSAIIFSDTVAAFTISRTGGDLTAPLTVSYTVSGTAVPGVHYTGLTLGTSSAIIPAGQSSVSLTVTLIAGAPFVGGETVIVTLNPGSGYTLGGSITAELAIAIV